MENLSAGTLKRQGCLGLEFQTDYRESVFHVGACNVEAYNWLIRWPSEFRAQFTCVFGPKGSGKTHLANIWTKRQDAVWITPEMLASSPRDVAEMGSYFVLDNADDVRDETWLFHFFNVLKLSEGKCWMLTAEKPPSRWSIVLPDLKSRLALCQAVGIQLPDDLTRMAVFNKILRNKGLALRPRYVQYLLSRIDRSYDAIFSWAKILEHTVQSGRLLNFTTINQLLMS